MKKRNREGKAQKRTRRNRQRHASRIGRWPDLEATTDAPVFKGPFEKLSEQAMPYLSVLAMRKFRRKEEKREGVKNG